jgi:disulfide bond formation protein DsbB
LRTALHSIRRVFVGIIVTIAVAAFYNAVVGVFGLPLAILSACFGVIFAVVSIVVTNKREEIAGQ